MEVVKQMTAKELERCMDEYGRDIYSFCRHLTCNPNEADDLYQDTFLKAMELGNKIERGSNPKSYFLSIAVRIWKNRKRKYAWRKRIAPEQALMEGQGSGGITPEEAAASPEEQIVGKEERMLVRQSVERLPERLRAIVLLYYMEELSVSQIAAVMKIPAGTVKSRLYQARKQLQAELEVVLYEKRDR